MSKHPQKQKPVAHPANAAPTLTEVKPKQRIVKPLDARTFTVTDAEFKPGKGLATALYTTMRALKTATAQQAADALLTSGDYAKVAPQAAKLRPVRPVLTLLTQWQQRGVVTV